MQRGGWGGEGRGGEMGGRCAAGGGEGGWWSLKAVVIPGANRAPPPLFLQCLRSYSFKISKIIVVGDLAVGKTCLINR